MDISYVERRTLLIHAQRHACYFESFSLSHFTCPSPVCSPEAGNSVHKAHVGYRNSRGGHELESTEPASLRVLCRFSLWHIAPPQTRKLALLFFDPPLGFLGSQRNPFLSPTVSFPVIMCKILPHPLHSPMSLAFSKREGSRCLEVHQYIKTYRGFKGA